jgi:hypothetical protein
VSTQSGCTDGNTYSVVCNSSGCVCQVNGMTTQLAMTTQCSSDAAVLDPLCGWHLHIFPQPPQDMTVVPDLLPPPDMTAGCTISGTFYLPGTLNPQNPCQICDPTIFSSDWSSNDNVTCGNGCGMCSGGLCGPVALTSITGSSAIAIALDANYAYFTEGGANGSVSKVPLNGGATTPLVQSLYQPGAVAVDTNYVYYTVLNSGSGVGTIQKVPLNGGTVTTLGSGGKFPFYIAIDSANVYWTDGPTGMVYKVPLSGGTVTTLASGQSTPAGIAVDATSVYFANTGDGSVMKVALGGGTPTQLASGLSMPTNLAMDATYLYLTTANEIWRVPLSGGTATALDPFSSPNSYAGLAIDGTNAYFVTEFPKGGLYALLLSGGRNATTVVQGQTNITPYAVAVNSTCVYFTANGNVERAPK